MKYVLRATKTFETIIPATELVSRTAYGEIVSVIPVPETRYTTELGKKAIVDTKGHADTLVLSGNWKVVGIYTKGKDARNHGITDDAS